MKFCVSIVGYTIEARLDVLSRFRQVVTRSMRLNVAIRTTLAELLCRRKFSEKKLIVK